MSWCTKALISVGMGLFSLTCLPEGKPPTELGINDIQSIDTSKKLDSYDYYANIPEDSNSNRQKDLILDNLSDVQYIPNSDSFTDIIKDISTTFYPDSLQLETLVTYDSIQQKDGTKEVSDIADTVLPLLTPYQLDENTVVLLHFDEPNPLENQGTLLINVEDYDTTSIQSMEDFGQARRFNGQSFLELEHEPNKGLTNKLTIEALVKPLFPQDSYSDAFGNLVANVAGTAAIYMGNNYVAAAIGLNNGEYDYLTATNCKLSTDTFTHIAFTYSGGIMRLYVNQELKDEKDVGSDIGFDSYNDPATYFTIGDSKCCNGFIGDIDEVRISNIAREF